MPFTIKINRFKRPVVPYKMHPAMSKVSIESASAGYLPDQQLKFSDKMEIIEMIISQFAFLGNLSEFRFHKVP